jgi:ligand-binding SRPBCC domain-containing protein
MHFVADTIRISQVVHAPRELLFDLARSVDAHKASTTQTDEEAIAGKTEGLMELGDEVTWRARHFGVRQTLSSRITAFEAPEYFRDSMVSGAFKRFDHDHFFHVQPDGSVLMEDVFNYAAPLGPLGWIAERLFLTAYMRRFLEERNKALVALALSDEWHHYLPERKY